MHETKIPYEAIGLTEKRPVKVYDVSRQQLIHSFESIKAAALFLDVPTSRITYCLQHKSKMKAEKNKLQLILAIR